MRLLIISILILISHLANCQISARKAISLLPNNGFFKIELHDYDSLLNATRLAKHDVEIKRVWWLNKLAYWRCQRMVRRIYFNKNIAQVVFKKAGHRGAIVAENAFYHELGNTDIHGFNRSGKIEDSFNNGDDLNRVINTGFNFSKGHYQNRVTKTHTKYGSSTMALIVNTKSKGNRQRKSQVIYVIHYDCFR